MMHSDDDDNQTPDGNDSSPHHDTVDPSDPNDPKKSRACEACRGLKVKCEPDLDNVDGPCKRCAKAGRGCVVTQPTRKRQKKTDSRVAELEKKIDALTATLHASRAPLGHGGSVPSPLQQQHSPGVADVSSGRHGSSSSAPHEHPRRAGSADQRAGSTQPWAPASKRASQHTLGRGLGFGDAILSPSMVSGSQGQKRKFFDEPSSRSASTGVPDPGPSVAARPPRDPNQQVADVVDRGILSMDQADQLFARYTEHMTHHLPIVIFPPDVTAQHVRKSTPHLFLSILAAAASELPQIQWVLVKEFAHLIAEKVVFIGEKSLELVQAILIGVVWYFPPEYFEELKFYQFVHLAGVMAIDIGLGKHKANARAGLVPYNMRDHVRSKSLLPDPTTIESRRTWLGCYFLAANVSMALHRPNLIRWSPFMQECIDILSSSPEAAPTDRNFCHLVWTHRLSEEIGVQFSMEDPSTHVDVSEPKVQYALKGFERDIVKYRDAIPAEEQKPSLTLSFHVTSLYMHEIALYFDKPDEFSPEALRDPIPTLSQSLTSAHINALASCLVAIDGIFDTFLAMDAATIRCLPIFNFVRVAYALVVLIRIYFNASLPGSELGKVFSKQDMKVQSYLDRLLDKLRETAASEKCRPASKFLVVLIMLTTWFRKQEGGGDGNSGGGASTKVASDQPEGAQELQQQQQGATSGNNRPPPPQLPSFVRGSNGNSSTPTPSRPSPQGRQQQYHPHQPQPQSQPQPQQHSSGTWQQHHHQQEYPQANTPLHLLSEVATGGTAEHVRLEQQQLQLQQQHQQQVDWTSSSSASQQPPPYLYSSTDNNNTDNNCSGSKAEVSGWPTDLDYSSLAAGVGGDLGGFEQAMDMTLTGFGGMVMMMGSGAAGGGGADGLGGGGGGELDQMQQFQQMMAAIDQNPVISSPALKDMPMNQPDGWFQ
ncbi:transcriptional regulatory protein LEU3 [Microdochium nivale]|nr:transcriptional regulatory protein LEU3 [Microdochium nivale]